MKIMTWAFGLVLGFTAPAWSKTIPVYEETGKVAITLGAEKMTHYTSWNNVPGSPGKEVHTASWLILKPMTMGGLNMATDDVFVTITTRDSIAPASGQQAEMRMEVSLDPITLGLMPDRTPSIQYYPSGSSADKYYALTNGTFEIESATRIDANTFTLIATAKGEMTGQDGYEPVHNPEDVLEVNTRFELQRVANRSDVPLP